MDRIAASGLIRTERLEVVELDGRLRLVVTGAARFPPPVLNGMVLERGVVGTAGVVFYDEQGDECGGLVFGGGVEGEGHRRFGSLMFDRWHGDQVVQVTQWDDPRGQVNGLEVGRGDGDGGGVRGWAARRMAEFSCR